MDGAGPDLGSDLLAAAISRWRGMIARPVASPTDLADSLQALYDSIYDTDFGALDPSEVRGIAEPATAELFDIYLTLRDRIPEWSTRGLMRDGAPRALRNVMRVLRYTIDIVSEVAGGYPVLAPGESTHEAFAGPAAWTLHHPARYADSPVDFRPGDALLMRGRLNNSAAIARIGDVDSQFSHVGMIHIGEDGRQWVVEALIEEGAVWTPLETVLAHGLVRAMLLRHRDVDCARRAATYVADLVARSNGPFARRFPYDFTMELDGDDQFFCSKLVRHAFDKASEGSVLLPSFPTRLAMTNRDFFERIGVTAVDTFAPGDLEVEPAFDIVAEWRDVRVTPQIRMQDLLMSSLFDWMDAYGYRFREGLGISVLALIGRLTSWGPDLVKNALVAIGFPKIPSNMPVRTITTIGMLHQTAQPILERLIGLERQGIATSGRPMHPRDVQSELERFRATCGGRIGYLVADAA